MTARIKNGHAVWQGVMAAGTLLLASTTASDLLSPKVLAGIALVRAVGQASTAAYYAAMAKRNTITLDQLAAQMARWSARTPPASLGEVQRFLEMPPDQPLPGQIPGG